MALLPKNKTNLHSYRNLFYLLLLELRNVFESISGVMREKYGKRKDTRICDLKDAARILFRFAKNYERRTDAMSPLRRRRDAFRTRLERKRQHHVYL